MKKKLHITAIILITVAGIALLSYPRISKVINAVLSNDMATAYIERVESIPDPEMEALLEQAQFYNESLFYNAVLDTELDDTTDERIAPDYEDVLSTDKNGLIGYIDIPKINVYLPIYHGTSDDVLKKGVGHIEGTSLPVGGEDTHSVISAHSGYPTQTFFDYLTELNEGDVFYIHVLNETLKYEVDQIKVVLPTDITDFAIIEGEDYVTLLTCTPYSINTHRLLVRGSRVPNDETFADAEPTVLRTGDKTFYFLNYAVSYWEAALIVFIVIVVAAIPTIWIIRKKRKISNYVCESGNRCIDHEDGTK